MSIACLAALTLTLPGVDSRRWEDEVVYVVIIEKFCDGDPSNNFMRDRFIKDRARYEGGFWGGDLKGVIDKLDDLADLGVTAILLYPVVQNDENPVGKFLPTGYRPKDYEHVDRNFGDDATLRSARRRGPRPRHPGDPRHAHHAARIRAPVPRRSREEGLVRSPERVRGPSLEGREPRGRRLSDRRLQAVEAAIGMRRLSDRLRPPPAGRLLEAFRRRTEVRPAAGPVPDPARTHDQSEERSASS